MILIQVDENRIPAEWRKRAEELSEQLRNLGTDEERADFIKGHSDIWKDLKLILLECSHGKCWYSEAKDIVADWHVDHFRPKGRVREVDGAERVGYWWLAFDWRNYRIAGALMNSPHRDEEGATRGKHDFFPLMPGCRCATCPEDDITAEHPWLLDPTKPEDVGLMSFDEEGKPIPVFAEGGWAAKKVHETVRLLFLDAPALREARRAIWRECKRRIERARRVMNVDPEKLDDARMKDIEEAIQELREMTAPYAELSATAAACIRANASGDLATILSMPALKRVA